MRTIWMRMTTRKTKKRRFDPLFKIFRHPLPPFGHLTCMSLLICLLALTWPAGAAAVPAAAGAAQSHSGSHAHDFVIFVTVFTDQGFALPGARVRVRRAGERKFRWQARSDRRGELAIRVKQDAEYEMTIDAHGFQPQTRKIDAREGNREDLTLQMEPIAGGKP